MHTRLVLRAPVLILFPFSFCVFRFHFVCEDNLRSIQSPHLKHLTDDRLDGGSEHLFLRSERPEHVIVLVRSIQLLMRHAHAVVARLRGDHVKVPRCLLPAKTAS